MTGPDTLPPNSPEAERGVLGCILLDADAAIERCIEKMGSDTEAFYDLRHRELYAALLEMHDQKRPITLVTVGQRLKDLNRLEELGGVAFIAELLDAAPSAEMVDYFLGILMEKRALRQVLQLCAETSHEARQRADNVLGMVSEFQARAIALTDTHVPSKYRHIKPAMLALADVLSARRRGRQQITGIPTPFWYLNNMTAGLQKCDYVVIGARPSTGKTSLGLDLMMHAAMEGHPVLFFSLEMAEEPILTRMVASAARMDGQKLRNGFWKDSKEQALVSALGRLARLPIYIDDRSALNGQDIMIATRRAVREHGVKMIVVDYIQLMTATRNYTNRHEVVAEASGMLKRIGKEMGVVVVALAQLSRDTEKERAGRRPMMADLKESGAIEQDADLIGLLWEPKLDPDDDRDMGWMQNHVADDPKDTGGEPYRWQDNFRRINLTIAKQRNGPTGDCELVFQKQSARFVDAYSPQRTKEKE